MNRILVATIGVIAALLLSAGSVNAQQFVAVQVEAEDFASKHPDWRLTTNNNTPNVNPDPDGSHAGSASGRAYLELLPDTRVTHGDRLVTNGNFWPNAGAGPAISYNVNIPESGRYLVFVKAYSTGTEDNGIHVGLNGRYPASGERIQWCSGKNQWTWSSAQRTNSNHCGVERTIFLDFAFAGANTINFSAREDGFEFDQFILLKTSNNSCRPNNNDQIACNSGTTNIAPQPAPQPVQQPAPQPQPAPVAPAPAPVVEQAATATGGFPACSSASSDPDGDGYGWENNATCLVNSGSVASPAVQVQSASSTGLPVCQSASSDPDGDGFGWEQNASCVVAGATGNAGNSASGTTGGTASGGPAICASAVSDPDGDGWGWENSQSCRVQ